eukprot:CAMPEP_0197905812 /NCGR_PEP_ID=MMETSP1439-20131203/61195_1 /TAXON_ID=66791 /ORGANISM="Gonyaulax spinifera, Strain CCMP409" /LENGTH=63 /DNA_ID=CAMNT_0043527117 /DNA_START=32 /DNA_END=220 /DNA_ORIENTATION=+
MSRSPSTEVDAAAISGGVMRASPAPRLRAASAPTFVPKSRTTSASHSPAKPTPLAVTRTQYKR